MRGLAARAAIGLVALAATMAGPALAVAETPAALAVTETPVAPRAKGTVAPAPRPTAIKATKAVVPPAITPPPGAVPGQDPVDEAFDEPAGFTGLAGFEDAFALPLGFEIPEKLPHFKLSYRLKDKLNFLSDELNWRVRAVTLDLVDMAFDAHRKRGRIRVGGDGGDVSFRVAGDIRVQGGYARIKAKLDLGIGSHKLHLDIPDFDVRARNELGRRVYELRVPLVERRF